MLDWLIMLDITKKYVSKPNLVSQKIFSKIFVVIHEIKAVLTLDKPIYVGFSILDLSKLIMYEFHYKYINNNSSLENNILSSYLKILMITEICLILVTPQNSNFFDSANKKVIGKIKDKFKGEIITKFVGLKSKMNSLIAVDGEEVQKKQKESIKML